MQYFQVGPLNTKMKYTVTGVIPDDLIQRINVRATYLVLATSQPWLRLFQNLNISNQFHCNIKLKIQGQPHKNKRRSQMQHLLHQCQGHTIQFSRSWTPFSRVKPEHVPVGNGSGLIYPSWRIHNRGLLIPNSKTKPSESPLPIYSSLILRTGYIKESGVLSYGSRY